MAANSPSPRKRLDPGRLAALTEALLKPSVRLRAPEEGAFAEPAKLSSDEVANVFEEHVPGVRDFIYRQQPGVYSLKFIQSAYQEGLRAFQDTELHEQLTSLLRLAVHNAKEGKEGCAQHLREVAEAFTDCQAVQARTIERVGLLVRGVRLDFRGHLTRLVSEYKTMAVKMMAIEECTKLGGPDEYYDPAHYESRILADLGEDLGLNEADSRQAKHDEHADNRFGKLNQPQRKVLAKRFAELFDTEALIKAFTAEAGTFGEETAKDSLPGLFLEWASERLPQKHIVFDEATCTRIEVGDALALAIFEDIFLGGPRGQPGERYRGEPLVELFKPVPPGISSLAPVPSTASSRQDRLDRLVRLLMSPAVQVAVPEEAANEEARLSDDEVEAAFKAHVPNVEKLLYREQFGNYSLKFIVSAYRDGFRAFAGSSFENHLKSLMRLAVHHGHENKPGAARYLRDVAEAFTDCQAVQARVVESVGLQIRGVALDFRGHLVELVDQYKAMAVKFLAIEECTKLGGPDDYNDPTHFESRIAADLGARLGLNAAHVRQAKLDEHAENRFRKFSSPEKVLDGCQRMRDLFDVDALLKALAAEASTFGEETAKDSLPRVFLDWATERMTQKHLILDEDTCTRISMDGDLALSVMEAVFLGRSHAPEEELYRGETLRSLFVPDEAAERSAAEVDAEEVRRRAELEVSATNAAAKRGGGNLKLFSSDSENSDDDSSSDSENSEEEDEEDDEEEEESEDSEEEEEGDSGSPSDSSVPRFEVDLDVKWEPLGRGLLRKVAKAQSEGRTEVNFSNRGHSYRLDLTAMEQVNLSTGKCRQVRRIE